MGTLKAFRGTSQAIGGNWQAFWGTWMKFGVPGRQFRGILMASDVSSMHLEHLTGIWGYRAGMLSEKAKIKFIMLDTFFRYPLPVTTTLVLMATNTCQLVNTPGVAVKASFQSKVWVGGEAYQKKCEWIFFGKIKVKK